MLISIDPVPIRDGDKYLTTPTFHESTHKHRAIFQVIGRLFRSDGKDIAAVR